MDDFESTGIETPDSGYLEIEEEVQHVQDFAFEPQIVEEAEEAEVSVVPEAVVVQRELREVLARLEHRPTDDAAELLQAIAVNTPVLSRLTPETRSAYEGVLEIMLYECNNTPGGSIVYSALIKNQLLGDYAPEVKNELRAITALTSDEPLDGTAFSRWETLRERVQRRRALTRAEEFTQTIRDRKPLVALLHAWDRLESPTVRRAAAQGRTIKTASEIDAEQRALALSQTQMRFSSGYRTLDIALTGEGEPIGFAAPGEQTVFAGMTGTGKSTFSYGLVPSMAMDLANWGYPDARVVWLHTEESSSTKVRAAGMNEGGRFHFCADRVIVDAIGSSRRRIAEVLYDLVIDAQRSSDQTGRPIIDFLPHIMVLDYIQAVTGERNEDPVKASITTAELLLRGVQAWNPEELAKFSGLSFRDYAGRAWPEGMEHHEVAVITFAQLNKQNDKIMAFRPNSKEHPMSDFTLEDPRTTPGWRDESGQGWLWQVNEGDARILRQNDISGSSVILKNATNIVFLHRSRPYNNPSERGADGQPHLEDVRARLLPDKTRNGSVLKWVPMAFDVDPSGFRARYYDLAAEEALAAGRFEADPVWSRPGDPLLPRRPHPHPLLGVRY